MRDSSRHICKHAMSQCCDKVDNNSTVDFKKNEGAVKNKEGC